MNSQRIAAATEYDAGHGNLLAALKGLYPEAKFNLAASEGPWSRVGKTAVDRDG